MMPPLLSIIIPHHNRSRMLIELLHSIPQRADIEIIVVDDHSDTPPDSAHLHSIHPGVRLMHQSQDQRYAGAARNAGLQHALGEWVFFADSDDLISTAGFKAVLDDLPQSQSDLIHARATSITQDREQGHRHKATNLLLDMAEKTPFCLVQFYPPWCKFIRRSLLVNGGITFDAVRVSNDVMFSVRTFLASMSPTIRSETVYVIREGHPSLTSRASVASITERLTVLRRYNALLMQYGLNRYRVPAIGQILRIARQDPSAAIRLARETHSSGDPVVFTHHQMRKLLWRCRFK